jgi:hypothetical protein
MKNMSKTIKFLLALAAGVLLVTAGILLSKNIRWLSQCFYTLYYFTPAIAVLIAERKGLRAMLRKYRVGFGEIDIKRSSIYILGTAFLLPLLYILCVWVAGDVLHIEQFGHVSFPGADAVFYGATLPGGVAGAFLIYLGGVVAALIAGLTYNMLFGLGGEVGWRGFLGQNLGANSCKRNIVTGLIWGTWYLPVLLTGRISAGETAIAVLGASAISYATFIVLSFLLERVFRECRSLFIPAAVYGIFVSTSVVALHSAGETWADGVVRLIALVMLYALFRLSRRALR